MTDMLSRAEARASGSSKFFTGRACRAGHLAERYTSSGQCISCLADRYESDKTHFKKASRRHYYRTQYGLTLEEADALRVANPNCAGCGRLLGANGHIDHCHATGKIRGLLCGPCNQALGLVKDSSETLRRLAAYLDRA